MARGARRARACALVGLSVRTVQRWRGAHPQDARQGPRCHRSREIPQVAWSDPHRLDRWRARFDLRGSPSEDVWPRLPTVRY